MVPLGRESLPVLRGHGLDTGTDTDVDHASLDLVGDVDAGLQAGRALAVQGADGSGVWEASDESGGPHLGGAAAGGQDGADADILHEAGVDVGALNDAPQRAGHQVGGHGVLEGALATLCESRSEACRDDNLSGRKREKD